MKSSEIQVGTEYAIDWLGTARRPTPTDKVTRCVVVSKEGQMITWQHLDVETGLPENPGGRPRLSRDIARRFVATWEEFAPRRAAFLAREETTRADRQATYDGLVQAFDGEWPIINLLTNRFVVPGRFPEDPTTLKGKATFTLEEVDAMLRTASAAARHAMLPSDR